MVTTASGSGDSPAAHQTPARSAADRGGQSRNHAGGADDDDGDGGDGDNDAHPSELPERMSEGRVTDLDAAERALVRKPKIGDTKAPFVPAIPPPAPL